MNTNKELVIDLLKYTFGLVPIVAGIDKFTNILTDWSHYLSPSLSELVPFEPETFMMAVGIIEVVAGVLVLIKTKLGALIVSIWLAVIALTLILGGHFIDVAVRDVVMAIAAFSLYKLKG